MRPERSCIDFLEDIEREAARAVAFLGPRSLDEFSADDRTAYAVVRAVEIVGEAAKRIPPDVRGRHPQVPWRAMAGIRDKLIHDYVSINLETVWRTVVEDLPPLIDSIRQVLVAERAREETPGPGG